MSPASSDASMLAVAVPAPLRPTSLGVHSCTRQHANLLVPGQIVSGLVLPSQADIYPISPFCAESQLFKYLQWEAPTCRIKGLLDVQFDE
jgi:hypothetical protein